MWEKIPQELKLLPQWVAVGPNKEPLNPRTLRTASIGAPDSWGTFEQAVAVGSPIGFVITKQDPYCMIDIDNKIENPASPQEIERHNKILCAFESYTERSLSGRGYHIIIKASLPYGIDRDHVGMYSDVRYMIMTGDVVRDTPIRDYHALANQLHTEASKQRVRVELEHHEADEEDAVIIDRGLTAINGDKFRALCRGDIAGYPSHSEADLALLSMLCFYTKSNDQVIRIFKMTELGKRPKSDRLNYLENTIRLIRGSEAPEVDISQLKKPVTEKVVKPKPVDLGHPPGLIGELSEYFHSTAIRPVKEVALAAALAFVGGIVGRTYNISSTGLNQYIILLAKTGTGKEGALAGIEHLLGIVRPQVPVIDQFLGPSAFASGQAVIKALGRHPCFVSVLGEFGLTLQQLSDYRANAATVMLRKVLLDLYAKSGWSRSLRPTVYSDSSKDTSSIKAPNVTILGESTPETFFDGLDISHILEGLIPRFSIIEYKGGRPRRNRMYGGGPTDELVRKVISMVITSQTIASNNVCCHVKTSEAAMVLFDEFDEIADYQINEGTEMARELWNRAHLKALKMGALIAVGCDQKEPVICADVARWAIAFVERDIQVLVDRFERGDVGMGDAKQLADVNHAIATLINTKCDSAKEEVLRKEGMVPYSLLSRKVLQVASLRKDRLGATTALKKVLQTLMDRGSIVEVPRATLSEKYKYKGRAFGVYKENI